MGKQRLRRVFWLFAAYAVLVVGGAALLWSKGFIQSLEAIGGVAAALSVFALILAMAVLTAASDAYVTGERPDPPGTRFRRCFTGRIGDISMPALWIGLLVFWALSIFLAPFVMHAVGYGETAGILLTVSALSIPVLSGCLLLAAAMYDVYFRENR